MAVSTRIGRGSGQICENAFAITPNDGADLAQPGILWVGGVGDLTVDTLFETSVLISAVPAGTLVPLVVRKVHATGTTATLIVGFY